MNSEIFEKIRKTFEKRHWVSNPERLSEEDFVVFDSLIIGVKFDSNKITVLLEPTSFRTNIKSLHLLTTCSQSLESGPKAFVPRNGSNSDPQVIITGEMTELQELMKKAGFAFHSNL